MPLGAQPRRRDGTVGHPYSPLNLRLALASFGLVMSVAFAIVLFIFHLAPFAWAFIVLAVVSVVDLVVIQLRRRARKREDPEHHSLFE
jgi:membrane protein YdbS with pleckstrin-like domain